MNKSFQIIRTNPRLTTNIKIVVDSNYNLYFESFDSSKELSNQQYKHYLLNREAVLENEIPKFYNQLPKNIAFTPKTLSDTDIMYDSYIQQFDNTYFAGSNEVEDQWYTEEFEYFAPLYIKKDNIPQKFIILRVDEPSIYKLEGDDYVIGELNKDNFRDEIIDKWKCVTVFDLSNTTNVGKFFDRNINNNNRFPEYSFFFDTKKYNYSKWNGVDYNTGVYKTSEMFLDDKLYYENPHFNFEEFITKGFESNSLIYPYIMNMKFLFDDSPATSDEFTKWSMNRYYGFYADDFELIKVITSAELPELKDGLTIKNNIFLSGTTWVNPYVLEYTTNKWIQVDNSFYEVRMQTNGSFKIISDINLTDYNVSEFNKGQCKIINESDNNYISGIGYIDEYITEDGIESDMYADIYLIEINGIYHILKKDENGNHYIQSDYAIYSDTDILRYWKGGKYNEFSGLTSVTNEDGSPLGYNVYRVKLTDIKDFDFDRINTHYSDFDFEKSEYTDTPEIKLYANEYRDNTIPKRKKTHDKGEDGQYKVKNISSEYISDDELFEIRSGEITPIFEKNQSICKWAYNGSTSHSDYPYKLNNNLENGGVYNRTTNTNLKIANVKEKTLDYFYRIGELWGKDVNDIINGWHSQSYVNDNWIVSGGTWEYYSVPNEYLLANSLTIDTVSLEYKSKIDYNEIYYIKLEVSDISSYNSGKWELGIDPSSFDYGIISGDTTLGQTTASISYVIRSLSDTLKIFVKDCVIRINTIQVTKVIDKLYLNQSINIQTKLHKKYDDNYFGFNLKYYIESNFDYFDYFFKNNMYYEDFGKIYKKPYLKYSIFNGGDDNLPSTTLFKGIEYKLFNVQDMVLNAKDGSVETIRSIITQGGKKYNGYKFSVILSENYNRYKMDYNSNSDTYSNPIVTPSINRTVANITYLQNSNSDGIHIFLNDKFKNVLIIINKNFPINLQWGTLDNVDEFGENYGLYNGKTLSGYNMFPATGTSINLYDPNKLSASYYIESLNNLNVKNIFDNYVCYYYIDENGNYAKTQMIKFVSDTPNDKHNFTDLSYWSNKFPPFYLETNTPNSIELKKNSYTVTPLKGPETNIYDKYLVYSDRRPLNNSYIDEPLSRSIEKNEVDQTKSTIVHGEILSNTNTIYRYLGYYEPIFKDLSVFQPTYYWKSGDTLNSIEDNYVFADDLDQFGMIEELMYSKVNEFNNYLKLKNSDTERSYYPMVDEIGLSQTNRFIFLSTWDKNFFIRTLNTQTLLESYVSIPKQSIISQSSAEIISEIVYSGLTVPYTSGIKIYGNNWAINNGLNGLVYKITVKNTSVDAKSIYIKMYYSSNVTTNRVDIGSALINSNESYTFTSPECSRPVEISSEYISEYTSWNVYFECYDSYDNTLLDSKSFINFNVYNNLINFNLSNSSVENGMSGEHITSNSYWFECTLTDTINKLSNISYTSNLRISDYYGSSGITTTINGTLTTSSLLSYSAYLDRNLLNWPYETGGYSTLTYEVYHYYIIEGSNKYISSTLSVSNYAITGENEEPNILWYGIPSISIFPGTCNTSTGIYTGDEIIVTDIKLKNYGGPFSGILQLSLNLYKYESGMWYQMNVSKGSKIVGVTINRNEIYPSDEALTYQLGPYYDGGTDASIITYNNINYKVIVSSNITSTSTETPSIIGVRDLTYTCQVVSSPSGGESTGGGTCLDQFTPVTMYNKTKKYIKDVKIGDKLLSYKINNDTTENSINWSNSILNGEFDISVVKSIEKKTVIGYYIINGYLKATSTHVMLVKNTNGIWDWITVSKIKKGDKLFKENGDIMNIDDIIYVNASINIVKIDVEETDNYFAGDVLNHNKLLVTPEV